MRRTFLSILLALSAVCAAAQRETVREEVLADWNLSSGLDCVYDLSPNALTPAPKGYQASYISHYGRHGSRYAYTEKAYKVLLDILRDGASEGPTTVSPCSPIWKSSGTEHVSRSVTLRNLAGSSISS